MKEQEILVALQRGLPLCARPFESLASDLNCSEEDVLSVVAKVREEGLVRRFGAVFDTRRLGYRSALCSVRVPAHELDAAAAKVTPLVGVTHCYLREQTGDENVSAADFPNLWFTLSCADDIFAAMSDEVKDRFKPLELNILPALRRYKVDVVFGASTQAREEMVEDRELPKLTARERAVIGAIQGDTEVCSNYFEKLSEKLGMREWDLLSTLELWRRNGRLKRIALLLRHRNAGWVANGMCCWQIGGDTTAAGRALAACGEVTHCYERTMAENFPYNVFAMVHARTLDDAKAQYAKLDSVVEASAGGKVPSVMLISTKEYKKTSMSFY